MYGRYINYFQGLFKSSSKEVRHLARIVSRDVRSVTSRNVSLLTRETWLSPWDYIKSKMQENFRRATGWRFGLLVELLENNRSFLDHPQLDKMI